MKAMVGRLLTRSFFHNPILVVGAGRSGTSIMLQGLGQHPQVIASDRESPFIPYVGYLLHPFEFRENNDYHIDSLATSLDYTYENFRRICFESAMGEHYGLKLLRRDLSSRKLAPGKLKRWCAKTFPNQTEMRGLIRLYPTIKVIYTFRSGINVVNSRSRKRGMRENSFIEHCEIWADHVEKYQYLLELDQVYPVRQEDVADDPVTTFKNVIAFLELNHDDGPANFSQTTLIHSLDKKTQLNVDVRKALTDRPPAYAEWTSEQKDVFKDICGNGMERLGYEVPF